jgi:Leucine-rich repeat (LRR) protein
VLKKSFRLMNFLRGSMVVANYASCTLKGMKLMTLNSASSMTEMSSAHILGVGFWNLIQKFSKVEHLSFSGNQFTKIPEWFRFPKSLKSLKISSSHVSALFLDKLNDLPDFELLVGVDINGMYDPAFSIDGRKEEEIEEKRALSFVVISFISSPIAINCLSVITP